MKKALLVLAALALVAAVAAYAGPGDCGMRCQANNGMGAGPGAGIGQGMGPGMGQGMAPRMKAGRGMRGAGMMQRGDGAQRLLMLADKLELTEAQKTKIQDMVSSFRLEQIDRRAAMQKAHLKMADLRRNDKATESQVFASIDEIAKLRTEMAKAQYRHRTAIQNVLTDKQKADLRELRMDRMHRFWGNMDDDDDDDEMDDMGIPAPPGDDN